MFPNSSITNKKLTTLLYTHLNKNLKHSDPISYPRRLDELKGC